jgi:hypothetical protein
MPTIYIIADVDDNEYDDSAIHKVYGYTTSLETANNIVASMKAMQQVLLDYDTAVNDYANEEAGPMPLYNGFGTDKEGRKAYQEAYKSWQAEWSKASMEYREKHPRPEEPEFWCDPIVKAVDEMKWS